MKLEGFKETYLAAFEAANAELTGINAEFERLRVRKEHIERLLTALRTFFGEEQNPGGDSQMANTDASGESNARPVPVPSDPFQRRIDHVLGIGAGIRDVRKYTRQF